MQALYMFEDPPELGKARIVDGAPLNTGILAAGEHIGYARAGTDFLRGCVLMKLR